VETLRDASGAAGTDGSTAMLVIGSFGDKGLWSLMFYVAKVKPNLLAGERETALKVNSARDFPEIPRCVKLGR
jgi:hypothetical protein